MSSCHPQKMVPREACSLCHCCAAPSCHRGQHTKGVFLSLRSVHHWLSTHLGGFAGTSSSPSHFPPAPGLGSQPGQPCHRQSLQEAVGSAGITALEPGAGATDQKPSLGLCQAPCDIPRGLLWLWE